MHDVERIARELLGEQVQLPRFEIRLVECHDETRIQIDRQHRTVRRDPSGKPLRHGSAARPDIEHPLPSTMSNSSSIRPRTDPSTAR